MISVAIMAHSSRRRFIPSLQRSLSPYRPVVVWDQKRDRWDTGRRSLLAYDPGASHHLVLQDDAIVCRDLVAGLEKAVKVSRSHPIALYLGYFVQHPQVPWLSLLEFARRAGSAWIASAGPHWGVGLVVPTTDIVSLVDWCDNLNDANYDRRIASFYQAQGVDCWYTSPSLVDHRPVWQNPSLVPGRTASRRAYRFLGPYASALGIDWTWPAITESMLRRAGSARS